MLRTLSSAPGLSLVIAATVALLPLSPGVSRVSADREVTVGEGDTLSALAFLYLGNAGSASELAAYNHLGDADAISVGQVLKLPDLAPGHEPGVGDAMSPSPVRVSPAAVRTEGMPGAPHTGPVVQTGLATWYGPGFEGSRTRCGQVFHQSDYTASSNDLPCGTVIQVTNLRSGRSVVVTVDDTGGFQHPTILDLSRAAFSAVASTESGVIEVSVSRVQF